MITDYILIGNYIWGFSVTIRLTMNDTGRSHTVCLVGDLYVSKRMCGLAGFSALRAVFLFINTKACGGWIRLIVGFQPLMVTSRTGLFGPNDLRLTIFGCQATDSIPPQVSRKESPKACGFNSIRNQTALGFNSIRKQNVPNRVKNQSEVLSRVSPYRCCM